MSFHEEMRAHYNLESCNNWCGCCSLLERKKQVILHQAKAEEFSSVSLRWAILKKESSNLNSVGFDALWIQPVDEFGLRLSQDKKSWS